MTADLYASRVLTGVLAGVVVAGALVLAGCTGEPEPVETPTVTDAPTTASPEPTETESPEPTETVTLPPLPDEARANTPEGAEAFIRYYFEVANSLLAAPQAGLLLSLAADECESCRSMDGQVAEMAENAQHARGPAYEIKSMGRVGGGAADEVTTFNMVVGLPANAILDESGVVVAESRAATYTGEGAAIWRADTWQLYGLNLHP